MNDLFYYSIHVLVTSDESILCANFIYVVIIYFVMQSDNLSDQMSFLADSIIH